MFHSEVFLKGISLTGLLDLLLLLFASSLDLLVVVVEISLKEPLFKIFFVIHSVYNLNLNNNLK